jgi:adenosylmethionine-8-amino-7-oxononanoate aminotransferase
VSVTELRASRVFRRVLGRELPRIARGDGVSLWDTEGRRYLDGSGGAVVVNIGHGRARVAEAMGRQAAEAAYVHGTHFTSDVLEEYAQRLAQKAPGECRNLYLVSGGSEANETAVKLARAYHVARGEPGRHKVIGGSISYHGNTLGTLALSGRPRLRAPYLPLLPRSPSTPAPFCYHCPLGRTFPECRVACVDELEVRILAEDPKTVSAVIAEPILGASAGAAVPPEEYARRAREICTRHGVLLIDDEVMTGFGRTGRFFGIEWSSVSPDIVTCGKGMSGGYAPVGAVLASDSIVEALARAGGFTHGFTFSHNPVVAAACLETLRILDEEGLVERSHRLGEAGATLFARLLSHPHVGDVRGRGLFFGIELVLDRPSRRPFPRAEAIAEKVFTRAFEKGLVTYPSTGCATGEEGDLILLAPPFVVTEEELARMAAILEETLSDLKL